MGLLHLSNKFELLNFLVAEAEEEEESKKEEEQEEEKEEEEKEEEEEEEEESVSAGGIWRILLLFLLWNICWGDIAIPYNKWI